MRIRVYGQPAPQGSKRHVGNGVMIESSAKVKPWREAVKHTAIDAFADWDFCGIPGCTCPGVTWGPDDALRVEITFYLPRPRGHYGTGRNAGVLKPSAPAYPARKPDLDKLIRATCDALSDAGIWADDSRVTDLIGRKRYADDRAPGAEIWIEAAQ